MFWWSPLIWTMSRYARFPLYTVLLLTRINGLPQNHMKGNFWHNSSLIGPKNQAKFENDCVSRNGQRIKITQPNSMILVSFSFAEDALFNDVKNITLLDRRVLKIHRFLGTPGMIWHSWVSTHSIAISELINAYRWRYNDNWNVAGNKKSNLVYTVRPNKKETHFISEISALPRKIETNCMLHY